MVMPLSRPPAPEQAAVERAGRASARRAMRCAALAAAVAIALAGCSGSATGSTLAFWSFSGIQQRDQVERYLAERPDARIELTEIGTSSETAAALTAALAGGNAPDLVLIQGEDLPRFVQAEEHFLDLRTFAGPSVSQTYLPWAWDAATAASGKVIGIPTDVGGMALAYRADLFAQAGLPTDPEAVAELWPTWDAFVEVGERFVGRSDAAFVDNASTTVFVGNSMPRYSTSLSMSNIANE